MKLIILMTLSSLLFACSSNQDKNSNLTAAQVQSGYECKNVKISGSKIAKKVCNTAAQRQVSEDKAEEFARTMKDG
jgi:hypothetical protein